jgi:hypothetical protein
VRSRGAFCAKAVMPNVMTIAEAMTLLEILPALERL